MDALVRTYDGEDLVITRKEMETLGLKPGDKLVIRPEIRLAKREAATQLLTDSEGSQAHSDAA